MRTKLALVAVAAVAVAAVILIRGGGGEKVPPPTAPPRAGESPVFAIPLPLGAVAEEAGAAGGAEVFRVAPGGARFGDIDEFYRQLMDGAPFRDMPWCGTTSDDIGANILRVWARDGETVAFTLALQRDPVLGSRITAAETQGSIQICPPPGLDP